MGIPAFLLAFVACDGEMLAHLHLPRYCWKCKLLESDSSRVVPFLAFGARHCDGFMPVGAFEKSVWCSTRYSNI